jgi:hypothetical protein
MATHPIPEEVERRRPVARSEILPRPSDDVAGELSDSGDRLGEILPHDVGNRARTVDPTGLAAVRDYWLVLGQTLGDSLLGLLSVQRPRAVEPGGTRRGRTEEGHDADGGESDESGTRRRRGETGEAGGAGHAAGFRGKDPDGE